MSKSRIRLDRQGKVRWTRALELPVGAARRMFRLCWDADRNSMAQRR